MSLIDQLKRRNVFRVGIAYAITAWLIAQIAGLAADSFFAPDWVMKMIITMLILGAPVALVMAWAYEMTPEGLKPESEVSHDQSTTLQTARKLDRVTIALVLVAIGVVVIDRLVPQSSEPSAASPVEQVNDSQMVNVQESPPEPSEQQITDGRQSVAVIPFINMSDDESNEYFSDGISEELLNVLVKIKSLRVPSRTSSFTFKGSDKNLSEIGRELGVEHILEGSVRKSGNRIRVTAQLIEVKTDTHLWSETYTRELDDIFAVQDEITQTVVGAIEPELGSTERERAKRKPLERLDAWDCYHRGLWHLYKFTEQSNTRAQQLMRQAIEMDQGFGLAHAGLADALYMGVMHGYSQAPEQATSAAFEAAQAALALDDKPAGAHFSLGRVYNLKREHDAAIAELQTAVALNPSFADAYYGLSAALLYAGRPEESIVAMDSALRLSPHDPYHWIFLTIRAGALAIAKRHDEALENAEEAVRHPGAKLTAFVVQAACLALLGRPGEARAALDRARQFKPDLSADFLGKIWPMRNPRDFDYFIDGLRDLGLPEHDGGVLDEAASA